MPEIAVVETRAVAGSWKDSLSPSDETGSFITLPARRGDAEVTVLASGVIEPAELSNVGTQVSGRRVGLGDAVRAGQIVGEMVSIPQTNAVRKAQASLISLQAQRDRARATLKQTQLAYRRPADILSGRAGTGQDYEADEAAYEGARADLANLEALIRGATIDVGIAEADLGYTRITAPINGTLSPSSPDRGKR